MILLVLSIIFVLIAANALYVAAEFAAVSVRKSRIQQMANDGDRLARIFLPVVEDRVRLDTYIAACQIGITISSLVLGAYGQSALPGLISPGLEALGGLSDAAAQSISAIAILVGLTALQVVLGELIPKSLALQFPARVSLLTAVPMVWSLVLFRPLIWLLNGSGLAVLRLLRAPQASHGHVHSPEEIELLIAQSEEGGQLSPAERIRLRRAMRLTTRAAHEVMIPRLHMEALDGDQPWPELVKKVSNSPYTRLPIYRESIDNILGVLHTKDIVLSDVSGQPARRVEDLMTPATVVPTTITVDRLLGHLRDEQAQMAIVIDEFGGVAGLVTLEDVLAEVFGDFGDEFKAGQPEPETLADGRIRLPGLLPVEDAAMYTGEDWLGIAVPGTHSDTIGGLLMQILGRIPAEGDVVPLGAFDVVIELVSHHAVHSVLVVRREPAGERA